MNMKKGLSVMLSSAMVAGIMVIPITASAAATEAANAEALTNALAKGGEIRLTGDVTLTGSSFDTNGKTVILDLNEHSITVNGTKEVYVYYNENFEYFDFTEYRGEEFYDEGEDMYYTFDGYVTRGYNAIYNSGNLTITGNGSISGTKNGISNDYGATLTIADGSNITVNGGTNGVWTGGTAIINCGTFNGSENGLYSEYADSVTINGGTFKGGNGLYNQGTLVTINSGTFDGTYADIETYEELDLSKATFDSLAGMNLTQGTYSGITALRNLTVPANSTAVVELDDAVLAGITFNGGTFSGTVSSLVNKNKFLGGTYTSELKDSLSGKMTLATGYNWIDNFDGTYNISKEALIPLKVESSNTAYGTINGQIIVKQGGNQTSAPCNIIKNTDTTIEANALPAVGYEFVGWYTNAEGTGDALSTDTALNITRQFSEETTIYAVFALKPNDTANTWLGDYDSTSVYTVTSKEDMASLAYCVNILGKSFEGKKVVLENNLTYASNDNYDPVGTSTTPFNGEFDGQSNTISGLNVYVENHAALFGFTGAKSNIHDLTVKDSTFKSGTIGYSYAGAIVGEALGTISDVNVESVSALGGDGTPGFYSGGVVGHTWGMTMNNISVKNITALCGVAGGGSGLKVNNVTVSGDNDLKGAVVTRLVGSDPVAVSDIVCDEPDIMLINSNADRTNTPITVSGENTDVKAKGIVDVQSEENASVINITSGNYEVESLGFVAHEGSVSGGTYNVDVQPYIGSGTMVSNEHMSDGIFEVKPINQVTVSGTYESANKTVGGKTVYDSLRVHNHTMAAAAAPTITYTITNVTERTVATKQYNYETVVDEGTPIVFSLLLKNIPEGTELTITAEVK